MPTRPNNTPVKIWVVKTKNFFVLYISKNGPHKGFIVHGSIIREVQKAICESGIPIFLYISALAAANATKGNPMANQVVGIQNAGCLFVVSFFSTFCLVLY